jgi:hypothetical protein
VASKIELTVIAEISVIRKDLGFEDTESPMSENALICIHSHALTGPYRIGAKAYLWRKRKDCV